MAGTSEPQSDLDTAVGSAVAEAAALLAQGRPREEATPALEFDDGEQIIAGLDDPQVDPSADPAAGPEKGALAENRDAPPGACVSEVDLELARNVEAAIAADDGDVEEVRSPAAPKSGAVEAAHHSASAGLPEPEPIVSQATRDAPGLGSGGVAPGQPGAAKDRLRGFGTAVGASARALAAPVARVFDRLGDTAQRVISLVALGTVVEACVLWGWLLFFRPAAPEDAYPARGAAPAVVHAQRTGVEEPGPAGADRARHADQR